MFPINRHHWLASASKVNGFPLFSQDCLGGKYTWARKENSPVRIRVYEMEIVQLTAVLANEIHTAKDRKRNGINEKRNNERTIKTRQSCATDTYTATWRDKIYHIYHVCVCKFVNIISSLAECVYGPISNKFSLRTIQLYRESRRMVEYCALQRIIGADSSKRSLYKRIIRHTNHVYQNNNFTLVGS